MKTVSNEVHIFSSAVFCFEFCSEFCFEFIVLDNEVTRVGQISKTSLSAIIMMTDRGSRTSTPVRERPKSPDDILQGFLCPECKAEFANSDQLAGHFKAVHLNERSSKENNLGNHLNKFLGKAKKILKTDGRNDDASSVNSESDRSAADEQPTKPKVSESECYFALRKGQTIGYSRDHFDKQFKQIRNSKIERDVHETNKLLIRIDQLLQDLPAGGWTIVIIIE